MVVWPVSVHDRLRQSPLCTTVTWHLESYAATSASMHNSKRLCQHNQIQALML